MHGGGVVALLHAAGTSHDGARFDPLVAAATVLLGAGIGHARFDH